ncbi:MAG: dephospho-CoA kinase [Clostridia bacterium]|nr:dephospho-CoA kinase [Clostridia bacterium]
MSARNKALRLGLTGGVGCGKSTVASYLAELGATVIDADKISHELTQKGSAFLDDIRANFGDGVFLPDGSLNRSALGEEIFNDEAKRILLQKILHPAVQREMLSRMDKADGEGVEVLVLDVPLLYECALDALCDVVWVVSVEEDIQALRVMTRDRITREQAKARMNCQMPLDEKEKRADRVIYTGRPEADVKAEVKHLFKDLTRDL